MSSDEQPEQAREAMTSPESGTEDVSPEELAVRQMRGLAVDEFDGLKFPLFSELPYELRRLIWTAAQTERTITIASPRYQRSNPAFPTSPYHSLRLNVRSAFGQLLVNHESRDVFLERYTRLFKGYSRFHPNTKNGGWYFNPDIDILRLACGLKGLRDLIRKYPQDLAKVKHLELIPDRHHFYEGNADYTQWPLDKKCSTPLRDFHFKTIMLKYPKERDFWPCVKETTIVLKRILQHPKSPRCEEGKCTRLGIHIHEPGVVNEPNWTKQTLCSYPHAGQDGGHGCINLQFYMYTKHGNPERDVWYRWNACSMATHLPEKQDEDWAFAPGTREVDLHRYTDIEGKVHPVRDLEE